jgi:hypothetical protein
MSDQIKLTISSEKQATPLFDYLNNQPEGNYTIFYPNIYPTTEMDMAILSNLTDINKVDNNYHQVAKLYKNEDGMINFVENSNGFKTINPALSSSLEFNISAGQGIIYNYYNNTSFYNIKFTSMGLQLYKLLKSQLNPKFYLTKYLNQYNEDEAQTVPVWLLHYFTYALTNPGTQQGLSLQGLESLWNPFVNNLSSATNQDLINHFVMFQIFEATPLPPQPDSPPCFLKDSIVLTDQGLIPIQDINESINTIRNNKIINLMKSINNISHIVCIKKGALGANLPNKTLRVTADHAIMYKNSFVRAIDLHYLDGIDLEKPNKSLVYNILLEKHSYMNVNGLIVETMNPLHLPLVSNISEKLIVSEIAKVK